MREVKKFFSEDNKLNKGYAKTQAPRQDDSAKYYKQFQHILPPLEVIKEYEYLYPGVLEKLILSAEKEQEHRHALDNAVFNKQNRKDTRLRDIIEITAFFLVIIAGGITVKFYGFKKIIFFIFAQLAIAAAILFALDRYKNNINKSANKSSNIKKYLNNSKENLYNKNKHQQAMNDPEKFQSMSEESPSDSSKSISTVANQKTLRRRPASFKKKRFSK